MDIVTEYIEITWVADGDQYTLRLPAPVSKHRQELAVAIDHGATIGQAVVIPVLTRDPEAVEPVEEED